MYCYLVIYFPLLALVKFTFVTSEIRIRLFPIPSFYNYVKYPKAGRMVRNFWGKVLTLVGNMVNGSDLKVLARLQYVRSSQC